uniref:Uncharacterized protein n=1 Tax=Romanomermis culicivorax TaxID=13658 RepID=A0A915JDQ9_ROMCU
NISGGIYEFTPEAIIANIRLLSEDQRQALENAARIRNQNIAREFVNLIPLQSVSCTTKFLHENQQYTLHGEVHALDQFELSLDILCMEGTKIRQAFETRIARKNNRKWRCLFIAAGQDVQVNQIQIRAKHLQDVTNDGDLFGPASETNVTRKQMNYLAQKIRTKLSIEEGYEVEEKLDQKIVQKLMDVAQKGFDHMAIDEALKKLSHFGAKFSNELDSSPSEIKRQLSNK